jgi:hypothetical protein
MADVTGRRADRAQLLIVAAIGIGILLIALALALNTAVYAEIHVSKTDNSGHEQRQAIQYQESVQRAVDGMIAPADGDRLNESELRANVQTWNTLIRPQYTRDGVATNASITATTADNQITQDTARVFEDQSGSTDWTVASNVSSVEAYETEIHADDLETTTDCTSGTCFTLTVEGGDGDSWTLVAANSTGDETTVDVEVETANGSSYNCTSEASSATVTVTNGTVIKEDGTECSFSSFTNDPALEAPYTLRYENADNASGTYNLSATGTIVEELVTDDSRYGTTGSPRIDSAVVAANVSVRYRSPALTYEAVARVAPGETDG